MKVNRLLAVCGLVLLTAGCYRGEIDALKNQIDSFKNTEIASLEEQMKKVTASVNQLIEAKGKLEETVEGLVKAKGELQTRLDEADRKIAALSESQAADKKEIIDQLNSLRTDLEDKLKIVNASIDALQQKDKELDQRIDDLNKFLTDRMSDVWTEFKKTADVIAGIDATLVTLKESINNVDASLSSRIEEVRSGLEGDLKKAVEDITRAYTDAITNARTEILLQVDKDIQNTIKESKDMILGWVNEDLLINYYTKAEIDAKIKLLEDADAAIGKDIEELKKTLEDVTKALEAAIKKAIEDAHIDDKIAAAIAKLMPDIEKLKSDVAQCLATLSNLETRIYNLEYQAGKMEQSIVALQEMDEVLNGYIEELQKVLEELRTKLGKAQDDITDLKGDVEENRQAINSILYQMDLVEARIKELQEADAAINERISELNQAIISLRTDMDKAVSDAYTWAQDTFVTQNEFNTTAQLVTTIKSNVEKISSDLKSLEEQLNKKIDDVDASLRAALSKAVTELETAYKNHVETELGKLETSLQNWVNRTLEENYWKKAEIQAELSALEKAFKDKDAIHDAQILKLQQDLAALDQSIENTCKQCIQEAVLDDGYIGAAIISKISALKGEIEPQLEAINSTLTDLEGRFTTLDAKIGPLETQAGNIEKDIKELQAIDKTLEGYISSLLKVVGDTTKYDKTVMQYIVDLQNQDVELKSLIDALEASVKDNKTSGTIGYTIQGWIDSSIETYYQEKKVEDRLTEINKTIAAISKTVDDDAAEIMAAISGIQGDVDEWLTDYATFKDETKSNFEKYLNDAKSYSDSRLADTLKKYYTKVQIDSILTAQNDTVTKHYTAAIEKLDKDLTKGYEDAIKAAVDNQGVINKDIQDKIDAIRGGYTGSMNDLNNEILALKDRVQRLEDIVQSLVIVPEYNGGVRMGFEYDEKTALPKSSTAAAQMQVKVNTNNAKFDIKNYDVSVKAMLVKTRAAGDEIALKVLETSFDSTKSLLTVKVEGKDLPDEFFVKTQSAAVVVTMSDKKTEGSSVVTNISSSYVNIYPVAVKELEYALEPSILTFPSEGGEQNVTVRRPDGVTFTITQKSDWLTIISQDPVLKITAAADNSGQGREGSVSVKFSGTDIVRTLVVKQTKRGVQVLTIAPNTLTWAWNESGNNDSGRKSVTVYPSDGSEYGKGWTMDLSGVSGWLANLQPTYNSTTKTTTVTFYTKDDNNDGVVREGSVVFKTLGGQTGDEQIYELEVSQALREQNIVSIDPGELTFAYNDNLLEPQTVTVVTSDGATDWTYEKTQGSDWMTVTQTSTGLSIRPSAKHLEKNPRYGEIVVKPRVTGGASQTLKVTQNGVQQIFSSISPSEVSFKWTDDNSVSKTVSITPDPIYEEKLLGFGIEIFDWEYDASTVPEWLDCSYTTGTVRVIYSYRNGLKLSPKNQNTKGETRECDIRVKPFNADESSWRTIHVVQEANAQSFTITGETSVAWNNTTGTSLHVRPSDDIGTWTCKVEGSFEITNYQPSGYKGTQDLTIKPKTVNYSFTEPRECTVTFTSVTGQTTTRKITQGVRPVPTLSFSELKPFEWRGNTEGLTVTVTPSDGVDDWKLVGCDAEWLDAAQSGSSIVLKVTPRDGSDDNPWKDASGQGRTYTLHFVNNNSANSSEEVGTLEVTQLNRGSQNISITPKTLKNFLANGTIEGDITIRRQVVNVSADGNDWTAVPTDGWIHADKAGDNVTVYVDENTDDSDRTGAVNILDYEGNVQKTINVKQLKPVVQTIELGATSGSFMWNGYVSGSTDKTVVVSVKSNDLWTAALADSKDTWITFKQNDMLTELTISATKMSSDIWLMPREGTIQFKGTKDQVLAEFNVKQFNREAQVLTVEPATVTVDWKGEECTATVTPNDNGDDWKYDENPASWISGYSVAKDELGVGTVKFTPSEMTAANWGEDRSCTIVFYPAVGGKDYQKTLTVTQTARPDQEFTPSPASGSTMVQKVTTESYSYMYVLTRYRYKFADLTIAPTPSDGESDWTVECKTAGFTAVKDGENIKISKATTEGHESSWSGVKSETLTIVIKPKKGQEITLTYNVTQLSFEDSPKNWFTISGTTIKLPALGEGYTLYLSSHTDTRVTNFSAEVDGKSIDGESNKVSCANAVTITIGGKGNNTNTTPRNVTLKLTVVAPDGTTKYETSNFTCTYTKNGGVSKIQ